MSFVFPQGGGGVILGLFPRGCEDIVARRWLGGVECWLVQSIGADDPTIALVLLGCAHSHKTNQTHMCICDHR